MKIVLAGTFVGCGGIQTHSQWLARALASAGHQVRIVSLGEPPNTADSERAEICRTYGDVAVWFARQKCGDSPGGLGRAISLAKYLREFRPDVYVACGTGYNLFAPALLSRACGKLVFHEVMSGVAGNWRDSRWLAARFFDEVAAQAQPVAQNFCRTFHWPHPVPVLPAFPEPLEMTAALPLLPPWPVPLGKARAAFFGRLAPHKQAYWLVQQWPQLKSGLAELHIFGSGPEETLIREYIRQNGMEERVFCHGGYPSGQAYVDLLSAFDLTLLPTIGAEGAPLVLLESMACGVPFVAFDAGGIADYANPDCAICPTRQPESFVPRVREWLERLSEGQVDRARLRNFYLNNFSFGFLQKRWLEYLTKVAEP